MPILTNARHERFAQARAAGKTATEAYGLAGFKSHDGNASRLSGNERIVTRVAELQAIGAEKVGVTIASITAELAKIGFANMQDYMKATEAGDPYLDFGDLTREQAAALAEVTVEDFTEGRGEDSRNVRRVKFKLHDKKGALVDLGRHLGMFPNKHEHGGIGGGPIVIQMDSVDAAA